MLADQYIIDGKDPTAKLQTIANAYQTKINQTYTAQQQTLQASGQIFAKQIKEDGFVMAGAYFMQAAKIRHTLAEAVNNYPHVEKSPFLTGSITVNVGGGSGLGHFLFGQSENTNGQGFAEMTNLMRGDYSKAATQTYTTELDNSPFSEASMKGGDKSEGFASFTSKLFSGQDMDPSNLFVFNGDRDPLFMAIDLGDKLETIAWSVLWVGLAGGFLNGGIATFSIAIWIFLILPAKTLGFVIPMLPFVIWIGAIFSWFLLVIEAFLAAPLWAVTHLNPEGGEGIQGKAGMGYSLILSLTLRPVLMILGLISAIIVMQPVGEVISATFGYAFGGATAGAGSMKTLSNIIAGAILYALMMFFIVSKTFELIHVIPDRIMKWMGGSESGLDYSKESSAMAMGTAYVAGRGLGNVASKGGQALDSIKKQLSPLKPNNNNGTGNGNGGGGNLPGPSGGNGSEALGLSQGRGHEGTPDAPLPTPRPSAGNGNGNGGGSLASLGKQKSSLVSKARSQDKGFDSAVHNAKKVDSAQGLSNWTGNHQSKVINGAIQQAKDLKEKGSPLSSAQETLLEVAEIAEKIKSLK